MSPLPESSPSADDHREAAAELKVAGETGAKLAPTLSRLVKLQTKAQYQSVPVAPGDANKAIEWAARLLEGAAGVLVGR